MTKRATPKAIEEYRTKLLTNPASLLTNMRRTRETLRERSEQVFIDRDLTTTDKVIDDDVRKEELERLDEVILRVGARIDDLDVQIEAHIKEHPDAELAAKLMEAPPPGAAMSRQHRREMGRQRAAAAAKAPPEPTEPEQAEKPTPISKSERKRLKAVDAPVAEETPEAD